VIKENLQNKVINATIWSSITEIVAKMVSPVTNMILARIISPEAFGVVATVTMIISFADIFSNAGFQIFLVQHEFKNEDDKFKNANVAFWTNLFISIFLWSIIVLFRKQFANLFGNSKLENLIVIASLQLPLASFSSIQLSLNRRDFDFKTIFIVRIISASIPLVVTVPLALLGLSYWAIIIGDFTIQLLNAIILTMKSKWKPKLYYSTKLLKEMISFSIWSLIEAVSIWITIWVDIFIIGNVFNQYYIGLYKTSISMVNAIISIITASVVPVLFSTLSRLQGDDEQFKNLFYKFQRLSSIFIFPIGVGIYLYSDLATQMLLGNQWKEASDLIGIWAFTRSIKIILGDFSSEVYRAKGIPKLSFFAQILHIIFLAPACIISSKFGFWELVYTRSLIQIQFVLVHLVLMKFVLCFPVLKTLKNILPTALSSLIMGIFCLLLKQINDSVSWSFISIVLCAIFYFGILFLFPKIKKEVFSLLDNIIPVKFKCKALKKKNVVRNNQLATKKVRYINMYKITVAGTGYVGLVAGVCFAEVGHKVTCVDIDKEKIYLMKRSICPIYEADLEELMRKNYAEGRIDYTTDYKTAYREADAIFIGVGTPEQADGSADLSNIAKVARQIAESVEKDCLVVIKSTVPVGTNDKVEQFIKDFLVNDVKVEVASNPEFLAQGSAIQDTLHASRIIIGTESKWAEEMLEKIYEPFNLPMITVSRRSAEMIKYASNDFFALKISYMNDIANLCELVGADIKDVAKGMSFDERIGDKFLNAGIGYGGSCFPKDTRALEYLARQNGYDIRTIKAAIEVNKDQKTLLYNKACKRLITFEGLKAAIFGLTFKPGTDDLREAPSLDNVQLLLEQGAEVYAYDPAGADNFKKKYPEGQILKGSVNYVENFEDALSGANICFIFTEWDEIKAIKPEDYKKFMKTPLVYDGRNIYEVEEMERAGVEYHSIGRKLSSVSSNKVQNTKRLHLYKINLNHEFIKKK
jgi:UDPglucose 6-dehydrogenase